MPVLLDRRDDGVTVLTLHDPDRRNAMTEEMGDDLAAVCAQVAEDDATRAVVVTGTPPAFSGGGDLGMLEDLARRAREEAFDAAPFMRAFYDRFLAVRDLPQPVVAAVNGHAIGAGLCVALACDLRVVANEAKVGLNFAKLGLHPGMGGSWLLPRLLGPERAALWLYTGRIVDGATAASEGMALAAHPTAEVLPTALEIAAEIAAASPVVVRQLKATLQGASGGLDDALAREATAQSLSYGTDDLQEGLLAARERRTAVFPGR